MLKRAIVRHELMFTPMIIKWGFKEIIPSFKLVISN